MIDVGGLGRTQAAEGSAILRQVSLDGIRKLSESRSQRVRPEATSFHGSASAPVGIPTGIPALTSFNDEL